VPLPDAEHSRTKSMSVPKDAIFVDPIKGNDANDNVVASIARALELVRSTQSRTIVLRGGIHTLQSTLVIDPSLNGLTIMGHPEDSPAIVSGGVPMSGLKWKEYDVSNTSNIWVASLDAATMSSLPSKIRGLQHETLGRLTVARYPNQPGGIEVSCGYDCMINGGDATWTPPQFNRFGDVTYYTDMNPAHKRNNTDMGGGLDNWFSHYMIGTNGLCSVYDPPVSYWCSNYTSGGGAFAFRTPSGVTPKSLPNAPYKDIDDLLFFVWRPARWANWMFEIESYDQASLNFTFGKGGNQGARGNDQGGDFYVRFCFIYSNVSI